MFKTYLKHRLEFLIIFVLSASFTASGQPVKGDSLHYKKIYALALKRDIKEVLHLLDTSNLVSEKDKAFRLSFEKRFKYAEDQTDGLSEINADIRPLVAMFQEYWRKSLLDDTRNFDAEFKNDIMRFLKSENLKTPFTKLMITEESLLQVYGDYIRAKGYHATEFGKTGFLYDLILWKEMTTSDYTISLIEGSVQVKVNFIDDFVSLGWLAYARMGKSSPGGWATKEGLYCVRKAYDLNSEKFLVTFLSHEGQHFLDYIDFKDLPSPDLEYRGKLSELYFGKKEIYNTIEAFINAAKYDSANAHPFANYCIIRDFSRILFHSEFEKDITRWQSVSATEINKAAKTLYRKNTEDLRKGIFLK